MADNAYSDVANDILQTEATRARVNMFGAGAADPEKWAEAQQNAFNAQVNPMKVQQAARENAANAALVQRYGPEAGAPEATKQVQENVSTESEQQREAAFRVTQLIGSAPPEQRADLYDKLVTPNEKAWGIDPAHHDQMKALLTDPKTSDMVIQHSLSLLAPTKVSGGPVQGFDKDGNAVIWTRDQFGNWHQSGLNGGTTAADVRATTGVQNAGTNAFNANTKRAGEQSQAANRTFAAPGPAGAATAPGPATGADVVAPAATAPANGNAAAPQAGQPNTGDIGTNPKPAQIEAFIKAHGNDPAAAIQAASSDAQANAIANYASAKIHQQGANAFPKDAQGNAATASTTTAQKPANTEAPWVTALTPKGRSVAAAASQNIESMQLNLDNANATISQMNGQISQYSTGVGSLLAHMPGGVQNDLKRNAETLKAMAAQTVIQGMKNSQGQTGIGRILQGEYSNFTKLYGNLEQDTSVGQYRFHLHQLQNSLSKMVQISRDGFKATWGGNAEDINPGAAPHESVNKDGTPNVQDAVNELRRRGKIK